VVRSNAWRGTRQTGQRGDSVGWNPAPGQGPCSRLLWGWRARELPKTRGVRKQERPGLGEGGGSQVSESCFLPLRWPAQLLLTDEEQRTAPEGAFIPRNTLPEMGLRCMR